MKFMCCDLKDIFLHSNNSTREFFSLLEKECGYPYKKEAKELEYEIKLDYIVDKLDLLKAMNRITSIFEQSETHFVIKNNKFTDYNIDYFKRDEKEFSVFLYDGILTMKEKQHFSEKIEKHTLYRNIEVFYSNSQEIFQLLSLEEVEFIASMRKIRYTNFMLDVVNGYVFELSLGDCSIDQKHQYQFEIEYFGHVCIPSVEINESKIKRTLLELADMISENLGENIRPTNQTKFNFLNNNIRTNGDKNLVLNKLHQISK